MSRYSVFLFDNGPPKNIPGFRDGLLISSFPFWGDYLFIDFTIINWAEINGNGNNLYLIAGNVQDKPLLDISERVQLESFKIVRSDNNIETIIQTLHSDTADYVLLSYASLLSLIDYSAVMKIIENVQDGIIKFSIGRVPIDLYACKRKELIKIIKKNRHIFTQTIDTNIIDRFFNNILLPNFNSMEDIEGKLLFQNNLMQIYKSSMWFIENSSSELILRMQNRLKNILHSKAEGVITSDGFLKNSILSYNDDIAGFVENSVIFPDVKISRNSEIHNSLIMNGNTIGENAILYNTIVFPSIKERLPHGNTIGEGVKIGSRKSTAKNNDYPEQINSGVTVIGYNPEIPDGYEIEAACYIAPDIPFNILRKQKKLARGKSIIEKENTNGF